MKHVNAEEIDAPAACNVPRASMHPYDVQMSTLKGCWEVSDTWEVSVGR